MDQSAAVVATAFWVLLLSGGILIALSGNRPAQRFLGAIVLATLLSAATDLILPKSISAYAYLMIDTALLALALIFVIKLDSYWPIWFAGFHSITVGSEISRLIYSGPFPSIYLDVAGFWSIPAFVAMAVGVNLDKYRQNGNS